MTLQEVQPGVGAAVGAFVAHLVVFPLMRRHLVHIYKRLVSVESVLKIVPTPAPGFGLLSAEEITNSGFKFKP